MGLFRIETFRDDVVSGDASQGSGDASRVSSE
jgi:hypothetical protein